MNSFTEWGPLELICLGNVQDDHVCPDKEPANDFKFKAFDGDMYYPVGQFTKKRIQLAQAQLAYFQEVLEGEMVQVKAVKEFEKDINQELVLMRSSTKVDEEAKDARTVKY